MEYTTVAETNVEKLARLEKELAEVRNSLEQDSTPDVYHGQYYKKNGNYYVVTTLSKEYILVNISTGLKWTLYGCDKKELSRNGFEYVGKYADFLKAFRGFCN